MNQDQLTNLVQSVFKIGGAVVGTYGAEASNLWTAAGGFAIAAIAFYFSHKSNASPAPSSSNQPIK